MDLYRYAGVGGQSKKQFIAGRPGVGGVGGGPPWQTKTTLRTSLPHFHQHVSLMLTNEPSTFYINIDIFNYLFTDMFSFNVYMCNCCTCIQLFLDSDYFPLLMDVLIAPSSHWQIQSDVDVHVLLNCHLLIHILA